MKRWWNSLRTLFLCVGLGGFYLEGNAQTMRDVFTWMPDSIYPLLTRNNRLDMMDFYDNGMQSVVTNRLDGKTELKKLTKNYMDIQMSASSREELLFLTKADSSKYLLRVSTFYSPAAESDVRLYKMDWTPQEVKDVISKPGLDAFWLDNDTCDVEKENLAKLLLFTPFMSIRIVDEKTLEFVLSLQALSKEDREKVKPYLRSAVRYVWKEDKFQPETKP